MRSQPYLPTIIAGGKKSVAFSYVHFRKKEIPCSGEGYRGLNMDFLGLDTDTEC
jgi:hypothetical protein